MSFKRSAVTSCNSYEKKKEEVYDAFRRSIAMAYEKHEYIYRNKLIGVIDLFGKTKIDHTESIETLECIVQNEKL